MKIDYWHKDGRRAVYADCTFYPNECIYRGNIYDSNGNMIGDYTSVRFLDREDPLEKG